jgi:SAM-dependent methyltransferase
MDTREALAEQYGTNRNLDTRVDLYRRFLRSGIPWHDWLLGHLALTPQSRVGDAGCGTGALWARARDLSVDFARLLLIDQSAAMIDTCRIRFADDARVRFIVGDMSDSLPEAELDCVVAAHVVYHLRDQRPLLRSAAASLRPGGSVYVTLPGGGHLHELRELLDDFFGEDGESLGFARGHPQDPLPTITDLFADVEETRYSALLAIDDAAPLVAYVLSYPSLHRGRLAAESSVAAFHEFVAKRLERSRAFHVENRLIRARAAHA